MFFAKLTQKFAQVSSTKITETSKIKTSPCYLDNNYFVAASEKQGFPYKLNELIEKFMIHVEEDKELSPKTPPQYRRTLQFLTDLWPFDDIREMDREGAEQLARLFCKLPKNPDKNPALQGLRGVELIHKNEEIGGEVISRSTVKKSISLLSTFFRWAETHNYVDRNYFYKLTVRKSVIEPRRYQLSNEDIASVFSMSEYANGKFRHPYCYWLPLLLRFTGARMNELCQLRTESVIRVNGVYGIRIEARSGGDRVKNPSSIRFVPLHKALISRGFLDYVNSCMDERLFPELPCTNGYYSHNASKWFARRRASLQLGQGKDAHSFRHSFIDELKQMREPISVIRELVGHSDDSVTTSVYSRSYHPELLVNVVNKIDDSHVANIKPYTQY
ncbi:Phage_integrase domain-containing protein [Vibrio jasicida]|uniref:site-specific integrase n=1 Tax=Vibrio jasicida TaxID=766224 RepID=UPI002894A203|nr:Phage_integrase domain-containing protein [Vibrio jasicida]